MTVMQEWKTVSVRLNETSRNALNTLCKREGTKPNKKLKELVEREVEPLLNPSVLPYERGFPLIGYNVFVYNAEKDNFVWQLDLGPNGVVIMAENITPTFLNNLSDSIKKGIKYKEEADNKIKKSEARVPTGLLKYKVRKNVRP